MKKLKGPILCFVGPPGVGKTSLAQLDRARDRPQVRAAVARRRARRGGDSRPPAHVHRRAAGQDHPVPEEGRHATTRCSCSTRSTRCRPTSAAIRRRRCSRCSIPSRTTTFNDHYLDLDYDLSDVMFITTANYAAGHPAAAAGPHGDHPAARLHRVREAQHRGAVPDPASRSATTARGRRRSTFTEDAVRDHHPPLHEGSGRPQPRARDRHRLPQDRARRRRQEGTGAHAQRRRRHGWRITASGSRVPGRRNASATAARRSATRSA